LFGAKKFIEKENGWLQIFEAIFHTLLHLSLYTVGFTSIAINLPEGKIQK
jgi:hypothetical protein